MIQKIIDDNVEREPDAKKAKADVGKKTKSGTEKLKA
jgi:hypothetical protein